MMTFAEFKRRLLNKLLPVPFPVRHAEYSMLFSMDDEKSKWNEPLFRESLDYIREANDIDLSSISQKIKTGPKYPDVWPGEHYKLLAAIVKIKQPKIVVEIGTAQGQSALCMERFLPDGGKLYTFDLLPWKHFSDTVLSEEDFSRGKLVQILADLSQGEEFAKHRHLIEEADVIFSDGPKNIHFEKKMLTLFQGMKFKKNCLLILDDIRLMNMLEVWRSIDKPKLDVTSFGHWAGTGLIDLSA